MTSQADANPYVGPRAISYGEPIYGRNHEIEDLTSTLVSQRIVLLYSPSGAGKSSLVEAGVRPHLEDRGFHVLPTIRVGHVIDTDTTNRYLMSTKLSLSEAVPENHRWDQERLAAVSFEEHLDRVLNVTADPDRDPCLVFDQFEELFTLDAADWDEKREFITELGVALRNRSRWALFSMREDYIAQLDPLLSLLPTRLSTRYRLDLLEPDAARLAMVRPARDADVEFSEDAADHLIDDLRKTQVSRAGGPTTVPGRYVEPVVLQAVCRRLWEQSAPQDRIGVSDVEALGDVDDALADFCDDRFAQAALESGVSEQRIRDWVEHELITDQGFRSQAASGPKDTGDAVLRALEDGHLLRAESRRGTTWYEIPHDRLVSPIRSSNRRWLDANLDPVQTAARAWSDNNRSADMLLRGAVLEDAERWLADQPGEVRDLDLEFVEASRAERQRLNDVQRVRRSVAGVLAVVGVLGVAIGMLVVIARARSAAETKAYEDVVQAQLESEQATAAAVEAEEATAAAVEAEQAAATKAAAAVEAEEAAAVAQAELEDARTEEVDAATVRQLQNDVDDANYSAALADAAAEAAAAEAVAAAAVAAGAEAAEAEAAAQAAETPAASGNDAEEALEASVAWDGEYVIEPDFPGSIEVRLADSGSTVGWLQQELRARNLDLTPDCYFGRVTEDAVKNVQAARGLATTGIADDQLWEGIGADVGSPDRLFACLALGVDDSDLCLSPVPVPGVRLVVKNVPSDDPDGGLNFRLEPGLESEILNAAPNGDVFTALGACTRIGVTDWLQLKNAKGDVGWAGSRLLFLDREPLAVSSPPIAVDPSTTTATTTTATTTSTTTTSTSTTTTSTSTSTSTTSVPEA